MASLHNNKVTLSCDGSPTLAFAIIDRCAYFYRRQAVARHVLQWAGSQGDSERQKRNYNASKEWMRPQELGDLEGKGHY